MINELQVAERIADGTLPSPQQFGASWYWAIRISGVGAAWRESENEFVWREPNIWLTPEMCDRAGSLPVLVDHPEKGTLNSPEFAARCVGLTVFGFVKGDELWAIARVLDSGANEILAAGAYEDTSPAVTFAPGTGARIDIGGGSLLIEPEPLSIDHIALCAKGVWTRDGPPGVENTSTESTLENEKVAA
jgi:colicin import membrane protein